MYTEKQMGLVRIAFDFKPCEKLEKLLEGADIDVKKWYTLARRLHNFPREYAEWIENLLGNRESYLWKKAIEYLLQLRNGEKRTFFLYQVKDISTLLSIKEKK